MTTTLASSVPEPAIRFVTRNVRPRKPRASRAKVADCRWTAVAPHPGPLTATRHGTEEFPICEEHAKVARTRPTFAVLDEQP